MQFVLTLISTTNRQNRRQINAPISLHILFYSHIVFTKPSPPHLIKSTPCVRLVSINMFSFKKLDRKWNLSSYSIWGKRQRLPRTWTLELRSYTLCSPSHFGKLVIEFPKIILIWIACWIISRLFIFWVNIGRKILNLKR